MPRLLLVVVVGGGVEVVKFMCSKKLSTRFVVGGSEVQVTLNEEIMDFIDFCKLI